LGRTQVAVCPNSVEIHVYSAVPAGEPSRWERTAVLREHDQPVCGLDWAPASAKLLSCSHDRNIYVWSPPAAGRAAWAPALVVHHLSRAALCAAWAPCERKFAVGSGSGAVAVCYYEAENDWWVGKLVKKHHGASVLGVAWHPSAPLLATACADGRARVLAAHVRGVDAGGDGGARFGDALLVCEPGAGWVHGVAWAPAGDALAFVTHAGGVHFVTRLDAARAAEWGTAAPPAAAAPLPLAGRLPCLNVVFLSDTLAVAAGFDCTPLLLARTASGWAAAGEMAGDAAPAAAAADKKSAVRVPASFLLPAPHAPHACVKRVLDRAAAPRLTRAPCLPVAPVFGASGVLQVADGAR
jgi:actin related protein 2/3 complex subunit 1A/1B